MLQKIPEGEYLKSLDLKCDAGEKVFKKKNVSIDSRLGNVKKVVRLLSKQKVVNP